MNLNGMTTEKSPSEEWVKEYFRAKNKLKWSKKYLRRDNHNVYKPSFVRGSKILSPIKKVKYDA